MESKYSGFHPYWILTFGVLGGLLGAAVFLLFTGQPRGEPVTILPPPTRSPILVHVSGAVVEPGVYSLPPDSRVQDAVEVAGGLAEEAFTSNLNLAAPVSDGDKVFIPRIAEEISSNSNSQSPSQSSNPSFPININTASADQLDLLPGIGPAKAQAIIDYRESNGPFTAIEQIQNVPGIGPATFENIKELITVGE